MELTVLGKYGPYPLAGSGATSGYLLEDTDVKIALDMGSGVLARLLKATDINELDAVYISHIHYDHTSDLLTLGYLLDSTAKEITVFTHFENSEWYRLLFSHPKFNVINIDENTVLDFKGLKLSFFKMVHPVTDYAIKVEGTKTFLYTGDTVYFQGIEDAFRGVDTALVDCTKPEGFKGPHMASDSAVVLQKNTGVKLIATHSAPGFDDTCLFTDNPFITVAEEGKTYIL